MDAARGHLYFAADGASIWANIWTRTQPASLMALAMADAEGTAPQGRDHRHWRQLHFGRHRQTAIYHRAEGRKR